MKNPLLVKLSNRYSTLCRIGLVYRDRQVESLKVRERRVIQLLIEANVLEIRDGVARYKQ